MTKRELAAIAANRYWSEDEARVALTAWRESQQPLAVFAATFGVRAERLTRWRRRLELDDGSGGASVSDVAVTFAPVKVIATEGPVDGGPTIRIEVRGIGIEVSHATPTWIAALVVALGRSA